MHPGAAVRVIERVAQGAPLPLGVVALPNERVRLPVAPDARHRKQFRRVNRHLRLGKLRAALEAQVAAFEPPFDDQKAA